MEKLRKDFTSKDSGFCIGEAFPVKAVLSAELLFSEAVDCDGGAVLLFFEG